MIHQACYLIAAPQNPSDASNQSVDDVIVKPQPPPSSNDEDSKSDLGIEIQPKFEISISEKSRNISGKSKESFANPLPHNNEKCIFNFDELKASTNNKTQLGCWQCTQLEFMTYFLL